MSEGQAGEDGRSGLGAQPAHHGRHVEAGIGLGEPVTVELPEQHRLLAIQHARVQQLREQALDPVRVLVDVFQIEDAAVDLGEPGGADQAADDGQVAAPQASARLDAGRAAVAKAHDLQRAGHRVLEGAHGDLVEAVIRPRAEVGQQTGARPGDGVGLRQHRQLEGGEIGEPHPTLAGSRQRAEVQPWQQAREAVAAARDHHDLGALGGGPREGGGALGIGAGEALVALERGAVEPGIEAGATQVVQGQVHRGLGRHCAGRGNQVDGGGQGGGIVHGCSLPQRLWRSTNPRRR